MQALNRAIEDADAFSKMLEKVTNGRHRQIAILANPPSREVQEWNAAVERKKAEKEAAKRARKAAKL